jgi:GNAT superfamily N-acetyltransferase
MRDVLIRGLNPSDQPALGFLSRHLGEQSLYQRFLSPKREISAHDLAPLADVDHWHREALIAFSPVPRAPIGVASYHRGERFDVAELAVTVADEWQRRGIGTVLMAALRDRAVSAGIRRFTATMLWGNRGALSLTRTLGAVTIDSHHAGVVQLSGEFHHGIVPFSSVKVPVGPERSSRAIATIASAPCSTDLYPL